MEGGEGKTWVWLGEGVLGGGVERDLLGELAAEQPVVAVHIVLGGMRAVLTIGEVGRLVGVLWEAFVGSRERTGEEGI